MTVPVDPVEALRAEVASLRADLAALQTQVRAALRLHYRDHAASGYDFRRAQTDSRNANPPAPLNDDANAETPRS
jgi:hypothetical protein